MIFGPFHSSDGDISGFDLLGQTQTQHDFISRPDLSLRADSGATYRKIVDYPQIDTRLPHPTMRLAMRQGTDKRGGDTDPRILAKPI